MSRDMISVFSTAVDTWYVSPQGNDRWSGQCADPVRGDGPFATLDRALRAYRKHRASADGRLPRPSRVVLRGGRYELERPVVLTGAESGWIAPSTKFQLDRDQPFTIEAAAGETPVLSGGRRITGWRKRRFNGVDAWAVHLPEVASGDWTFTQLWVNGRRAPRTRWPRHGEFRVAGLPSGRGGPGTRTFHFAPGTLCNWANLQDVEFVGLICWTEVRLSLARVNEATCTATLSQRSHRGFAAGEEGTPYWVENVREFFGQPGEWYLDRPSGMLYYRPRSGEQPGETEVIAPRLGELLRFDGRPEAGRWVEQIVLRGLRFAHTEWQPGAAKERADGAQSAAHLPGAVRLRGCRRVRFEDCTVHHVGTHGVELLDGSRDVVLSRCTLHDLAAGGVKVWHGCRRVSVEDSELYDGGRRHHRACGILIGNCPGNRVVRNHIHDFDYTGVSVGWTWGYAECDSGGNVIEQNHIHHIGRGVLSDLGAIYTLGVQPGTRIRFNHLHDVTHRTYGSYGIYLDEGSSSILVEGNLVYRIRGSSLFLHWGGGNLLRGNFFCGGGESVVGRAETEQHDAMSVEGNVLVARGAPVHGGDWSERSGAMDRNLYWDLAGGPVRIGPLTLAEWQARGMDLHSVAGDPGFADAAADDYRLRPDSPAGRLGITFPAEALAAGPARVRPPARPLCTGMITRFLVSPLSPGAGRLEHLARPPAVDDTFVARDFPRGFANLHAELYARREEDPLVWFACPIRAERGVPVDISLGYDGPVRLWLDRRLLFADPDGINPHQPGKAIIPARLTAGEHGLLIAFGSNQGRAYGISLGLVHRPPARRRDKRPRDVSKHA